MTRLIEHYGLQHAGFVARPLYTCTRRLKGGDMCMKVASMSKFIQQHDERTHYRCTQCRQEESAASTLVFDSVPLRILQLYILVRDGNKTTIMRASPYRLCLCAPPSQWGWDKELYYVPDLSEASPTQIWHARKKFYQYNDTESDAIWTYSSPYKAES